MRRGVLALLLAACGVAPRDVTVGPPRAPIEAPADGLIRYTLSFDDAKAHLVDVEMLIPTGGAPTVELMMATWTPGSYLVREYARHIEGLEVEPGSLAKTAKNRWTVQTDGADVVRVRYRLYARELTVRTNFVDADLGMLNGASTFLVPVDGHHKPLEVALKLPEAWPSVATALDPVPGQEHTFRARDFDELVDSPIVAGELAVYDFEVQGVPHQLVNWGESGVWDGPRSARDVEKLVQEQTAFWGSIPYDRYLFLNVIGEVAGGLEHKRSTLMLTSRWKTHTDDAYEGWLGLVSHEFFHTWNVKRLRPVELGPFDYESEVLTENLWVAEGFTSYYDDLLLARAGLIDEDEWLTRSAKNIQGIQQTPGRSVHPLRESSRDAWIKHYRPDENSPNTTVSYYTKGAVVAFLLDAEIRSATADARSLDDLMRRAYDQYGGERGFTSAEFRSLANDVAKLDLGPFFEGAVDGTGELDYSTALDWYGLRFKPEKPDEVEGEAAAEDAEDEAPEKPAPVDGWIGLNLKGNTVSGVTRGTPAFDAGLNVDDEILAINGFRVDGSSWSTMMQRYHPGTAVEVLVSRRGQLRTLSLSLSEKPRAAHTLERDPSAKPTAVEHRKRLLGSGN